jgi:hypothetical protein
MSDRPRPEYGEYASVDEQVAAGGIPVEAEPAAPVVPAKTAVRAPLAPPDPGTRVEGAPPVTRTWDVMLTVGLLVFGVFMVVDSIPGFLDLPAAFREAFVVLEENGYAGEGFDAGPVTAGIGVAMLVIHSIILVVTVAISLVRLRARRIAFFVPVAGGVLAGIVAVVLMLVAANVDPSFAVWMNQQRG